MKDIKKLRQRFYAACDAENRVPEGSPERKRLGEIADKLCFQLSDAEIYNKGYRAAQRSAKKPARGKK